MLNAPGFVSILKLVALLRVEKLNFSAL